MRASGHLARPARAAVMFRPLVLMLMVTALAEEAGAERQTFRHSSGPTFRKLFIEPSSSRLLGGKAKLVVGTLSRQGKKLVGNYQIRVTPYFFKSEKGRLSIALSDSSLQALLQGMPAEFSGVAETDDTNEIRPITANATPSANDRGALLISVGTENGKLPFQTSYRMAD
jgi:hypothetical protein